MLKIILLGIFTFALLSATAQIQTQVIGDSVFMHSNTGKSELILQNSTDTVNGFLFNNGAGRTAFRRALVKINDSLYLIGADTLHIHNTDAGMTNGWSLTGNSATTPGTNFIGTTDNLPLLLKVNNTSAGYLGTSTNYNTSFGILSLPSSATGAKNTALGASTLSLNTSGNDNVASGYAALKSNTSGYRNAAIGYESMYQNISGYNNVAIGNISQSWDTASIGNTSVGSESMNQAGGGVHNGGSYNSAFGYGALGDNWNNKYNIGIGYLAGEGSTSSNTLYIADSTFHMKFKLDSASDAAPSVIGKDANGFWHVYPTPAGSGGSGGGTVTNLSTGYGLIGGPITTSGTIVVDTTALHQKFVGFEDSTVYYPYNSNPKGYLTSSNAWSSTGNAGTTSSNFLGTTDNMALQFKVNNIFSGFISTSPSFSSTAFGNSALSTYSTGTLTGNPNTAFGSGALTKVTSGSFNTAVGHSAGGSFTTGYYNTSIGNLANDWNQTGINNTSVGEESMGQAGSGVHNHSYNTAIGFAALADNYGNYNIGLGNRAGQGGVGDSTLFVSDSTIHMKFRLDSIAGDARNIIGKDANGFWHVYQIPAGINGGGTVTDVATGFGLLGGPITTTGSIAVDTAALHQQFLEPSDSTVYYPYASNPKGYLIASNAWNTTGNAGTTLSDFIGTTDNQPLIFKVGGISSGRIETATSSPTEYNVAFGLSALQNIVSGGNYNTAIGSFSLYSNTSGFQNTAVGLNALRGNTTGNYNTALGINALDSNSIGNNNVAFGNDAMQFNKSGSYNTSFGNLSMQNSTTSNYNVAIGHQALYTTTNVNYSIALGLNSGNSSPASNTFYIADSTYHMRYKLDSAAGSAPSVIGKDANGFWHVYQSPSPGSAGITTIQEDGTSLTARPTLNFNYGVTATDNAASSTTAVDINLSTASNSLTTDVSMSSGSTFYDGGTVSLAAGTWLITATATIESSNNSAMKITGKIWDGTTVYSASEGSVGSLGGGAKGYVNISMNSLVTVSSTTTIKGSYASTIASCSLKAATADNNTGTAGKTTSITAVRIK
jgi:trimeric autotransporter adhesin